MTEGTLSAGGAVCSSSQDRQRWRMQSHWGHQAIDERPGNVRVAPQWFRRMKQKGEAGEG